MRARARTRRWKKRLRGHANGKLWASPAVGPLLLLRVLIAVSMPVPALPLRGAAKARWCRVYMVQKGRQRALDHEVGEEGWRRRRRRRMKGAETVVVQILTYKWCEEVPEKIVTDKEEEGE